MKYLVLCLAICGCGPDGGNGRGHLNDLGMNSDMPMQIGDGAVVTGTLAIMPLDPVITVMAGQPGMAQFTATVDTTPVTPSWAIDRGEIGSIDANGLFTTTGTVGGKATISAIYAGQKVTTSITVKLTRTDVGDPAFGATADAGAGGYGGVGGDGPGGPASTPQQTTLSGNSIPDNSVTILYPYDQTVWPRGLLAPLLQWDSGTHHFDSIYVHIQETGYEYKGFFTANNTPFRNLPIPQKAWDEMTYSNGGEAVMVSLVFGEGASAIGPVTQMWKVAPATLKGTVYYNSYGTYLVKNSDSNDANGQQYGAGTLAINPGATAPVLVAGTQTLEGSMSGNGNGCRVCHTVNMKGSVVFTQHNMGATTLDYSETDSIDLLGMPINTAGTVAGKNLAFPALYPDGSLLFSAAGGISGNNGWGDPTSTLYTVASGVASAVTANGLPTALQAAQPAFSPDGKHVAFVFWGATDPSPSPQPDQASIAMMDFDGNRTFSNFQIIYQADPAKPVSWLYFLPTATGIVFEVEENTGAYGFTWSGSKAQMWWVDIATKVPHRLDNLNGLNLPVMASSTTHLMGDDAFYNYEPTVNPIASGGYAWIVFTSRRLYGNVATNEAFLSDPRDYDATTQFTTKKLWVAAFDLNAMPDTDPSHPAFYLPAQELHAGNSRGYWTTEACRNDNATCQTGDECCGGYCEVGPGNVLVCTSTPPVCAADFEKCTMDSDCCPGPDPLFCINGFCTLGGPPIP